MVTSLIPATWREVNQHKGAENQLLPNSITLPPPSLYSIIDTYGPFPGQSSVVGISGDGFPFILDLNNSRSGSILVVGDNNHERSQLLRTICLSSSMINRPDQVTLFIISNKPDLYSALYKFPNCQAIVSSYERSAGELLIELASVVEQRRSGRERGPTVMLMIDDFRSIKSILNDYSVYLNLKSMVNLGPQNGVWPIIAILPGDVHSSRGQLLRSFGTYIFEKNENNRAYLPDNSINPGDLVYEPNFDLIVGGRLLPISNLIV